MLLTYTLRNVVRLRWTPLRLGLGESLRLGNQKKENIINSELVTKCHGLKEQRKPQRLEIKRNTRKEKKQSINFLLYGNKKRNSF